jgi:hypothetical protein
MEVFGSLSPFFLWLALFVATMTEYLKKSRGYQPGDALLGAQLALCLLFLFYILVNTSAFQEDLVASIGIVVVFALLILVRKRYGAPLSDQVIKCGFGIATFSLAVAIVFKLLVLL